MVKPSAGYRPLAYSSPEAVQTTGTVAIDTKLVVPTFKINTSRNEGWHQVPSALGGFSRRDDNIFVERLWWTVKHEWVYLRPAANGIEQKRSLGEFFDWYNLRRPHQALGWRTPDEAYRGQSTAATALAA